MKLEIQERGVMLSDYFCGTPGVMLPLYIDKNTTCKEVLDLLEEEINMVWDHIEYTAENHGFDISVLEYHIDSELAEMDHYIRENGKSNLPYNPDLDFSFDDIEEDEETPAAIFTIEFWED